MSTASTSPSHRWRFFRAGGFDQVRLETADDLRNLATLDQNAVVGAIPGQALSYKVGQLKILALRKEAETALGKNFNLSNFHDELLTEGCLPISV